jgi:hypothetical protein
MDRLIDSGGAPAVGSIDLKGAHLLTCVVPGPEWRAKEGPPSTAAAEWEPHRPTRETLARPAAATHGRWRSPPTVWCCNVVCELWTFC